MTAASVFDEVVAKVGGGSTPGAVARNLGVPIDLVEGIVSEASRLGLLRAVPPGCGGCHLAARPTPAVGVADHAGCVTCPLPRVGTAD